MQKGRGRGRSCFWSHQLPAAAPQQQVAVSSPSPTAPSPLSFIQEKPLRGHSRAPDPSTTGFIHAGAQHRLLPAFSSKHHCLQIPSTFPWHPAPPPQLQFLASRGPCHMHVALQGAGLQIQRGPSRCNQLQQGTRAALRSPDTRRFPTTHNKQP